MSYLVTSRFLGDKTQELKKLQTQLLSLLVFGDCYVLDMALDSQFVQADDQRESPYLKTDSQFLLDDQSSCPDNSFLNIFIFLNQDYHIVRSIGRL